MFSLAFNVGTRLNDWNTKPSCSRRTRVSWRSLSRPSSRSPMNTWPEVSVSSPARQCRSVLLPLPDGPITAVKRPSGIATSTPSRARTVGRSRAVDLDRADGAGSGLELGRRVDRRQGREVDQRGAFHAFDGTNRAAVRRNGGPRRLMVGRSPPRDGGFRVRTRRRPMPPEEGIGRRVRRWGSAPGVAQRVGHGEQIAHWCTSLL